MFGFLKKEYRETLLSPTYYCLISFPSICDSIVDSHSVSFLFFSFLFPFLFSFSSFFFFLNPFNSFYSFFSSILPPFSICFTLLPMIFFLYFSFFVGGSFGVRRKSWRRWDSSRWSQRYRENERKERRKNEGGKGEKKLNESEEEKRKEIIKEVVESMVERKYTKNVGFAASPIERLKRLSER